MPTRTRLLLNLLAAALACSVTAQAQDVPSSSYRLRAEQSEGQPLHVTEDAKQTPARISASLSDDEPAVEDESEARSQEPEHYTEGTRGSGAPSHLLTVSPTLRPAAPSTLAADKPLKLSPRSETGGRQLAKPNPAAGLGSLGTVGGALAVVLGLFVVVVWVTRRVGPSGSAPLPTEAVELLGRTTVSGPHALQLVRVGSRLLLVALSPQGASTLTEISDPHEVERLIAICQRQRSGSASQTFAQTVSQLERESTARSFVDQRRPANASLSNRTRSSRAA